MEARRCINSMKSHICNEKKMSPKKEKVYVKIQKYWSFPLIQPSAFSLIFCIENYDIFQQTLKEKLFCYEPFWMVSFYRCIILTVLCTIVCLLFLLKGLIELRGAPRPIPGAGTSVFKGCGRVQRGKNVKDETVTLCKVFECLH